MKCIECECCRKGWFKSKPAEYVCIGVKEPFVIKDANVECTEYPEKNKIISNKISANKFIKNAKSKWVPVVHGRWIWKDFRGDDTYILACSECLETEGARESAKYCSNCGARMDLED